MTEEFHTKLEKVRNKVYSTQQKMIRISQGNFQPNDKASIQRDIEQLEIETKQVLKEFKEVMPQLDAGEANQCEQQCKNINQKMQDIQKQYKNYLSQSYTTFNPEAVNQEDVTVENMQQLTKKREEDLIGLSNQVKVIKNTNQQIKENLDVGDEVMAELKDNIGNTNSKVVDVKGKTNAFTNYLKKNKAPFLLVIIFLIISVLIWSSKAFCSWGFSWQCPK